jgi:putative ABC transport system permease protein
LKVEPGWRTASLLEFATNAATTKGEQHLVEVKAVAPEYPLRGEVLLRGGGKLAAALANNGTVVESSLLARLNIAIGDTIRIGDALFTIRDVLAREPDRVTNLFSFGPRVISPLARAQ